MLCPYSIQIATLFEEYRTQHIQEIHFVYRGRYAQSHFRLQKRNGKHAPQGKLTFQKFGLGLLAHVRALGLEV